MNSDTSDSENDLNDDYCTTPHDDTEVDKEASIDFLTDKSRKMYDAVYKAFMDWRNTRNYDSFSEDVLLDYFNELSEKYKSTSLWVYYSMLRNKLNINNGINIESYSKLRSLLRRLSKGYQPKRHKMFTPEQINKFISEAPDDMYLAIKVALIMGITGGCRRYELHAMTIENIQDLGSAMLVTIPKNKTKIKKFTLTDHFYRICRKYIDLRPTNIVTSSFFLNYHNGKCSTQQIGINKLGAMGKEVAKFLELPNPELYTGHCLRRSPAILFADTVENLTIVEKHCIGTSTRLPENSVLNSVKTENMEDDFFDTTHDVANHNTQRITTNENMDFTTVLFDADGNITTLNRHSGFKATEGSQEHPAKFEKDTSQNFFESMKQSTSTCRQISSQENVSFDINSTPSLHFTNCSNITINIINNKCKCNEEK